MISTLGKTEKKLLLCNSNVPIFSCFLLDDLIASQADLEYEKSVNTRLTQEIRRNQSSAMDTTCFRPQTRASSAQAQSTAASTNTSVMTSSASSDSPVWSSGSGALKEIRLHDAEMKVKSLEKDNARLKEHEEFYINKAREWKNRALKYETPQ